MGKSANRKDVVLGVTPELAERLNSFRAKLVAERGEPVTQTEVYRLLLVAGLDALHPEKKPEPLKPVEPKLPEREKAISGMRASAGSAVPRFATTSDDD